MAFRSEVIHSYRTSVRGRLREFALGRPTDRKKVLRRPGVTIVELMVSVALTLIVVLAIVRVFDLLGGSVTESRSILELSAQLRSASTQLQQDLDRLTAQPTPPLNSQTAAGYLEIIEGVRRDADIDGDGLVNTQEYDPNNYTIDDIPVTFQPASRIYAESDQLIREVAGTMGDTDDVLMGTIRSTGEPFRGQIFIPAAGQFQVIESPLAEIVYWIQPILGPGTTETIEFVISRRRLLILPTAEMKQRLIAMSASIDFSDPVQVLDFLWHNDLSVRPEVVAGNLRLVPNNLSDLQVRRNRFAHWPDALEMSAASSNSRIRRATTFWTMADRLNRNFVQPPAVGFVSAYTAAPVDITRHVFAQDALSFDVRVYDPLAPLFRPVVGARYVVTPTDPSFGVLATPPGNAAVGYGAYVDLGYAHAFDPTGSFARLPTKVVSNFSDWPAARSRVMFTGASFVPLMPRVYDTWTTLYERDGINPQDPSVQEVVGSTDEGRDGLDNNGNLAIDELEERETAPPYAHPLRGLEVILRVREVSSQQVRQASVVADFVSP